MPPPLVDGARDDISAPPRLVVDDGALRAVIDASAGGTGVFLTDERRMANFARVGCGDPATAAALNTTALGQPLASADRKGGRVSLRRLPIPVVGVLTLDECETLQTARAEELLGTVFVGTRRHACDGDGRAMLALVRRVHELGAASSLKLNFHAAATAALGEAAQRWKTTVDKRLDPITTYINQLPDLAQRIAAALHLIGATAKMKLTAEIPASAIRSAVAMIDAIALGGARHILGPVSAATPEEADAIRIIAALRHHTSVADAVIEKRELSRRLQNAVPSSPRFKAAARMLERLNLISPAPPPEGQKGEHLKSEAALHI
ncbi:hypothetical protein [Pseudolabrys sp. FHR47]|uniref:hypothetical protein n=1 Tax=Pseudolabrys sp. FHR47 TaxID=2562284 RepID=UPI0010BEC37F|nr:hypothetical protein [Pseudolabrys sp. FHR47]